MANTERVKQINLSSQFIKLFKANKARVDVRCTCYTCTYKIDMLNLLRYGRYYVWVV